MANLKGFKQLQTKLKAMSAQKSKPEVTVGYTAKYAVFVHENLAAHHVVGQAKFLEQPARQLAPLLGPQVTKDVKNGMRFDQALFRAGLRIQRASMPLVPVLTGALRASAFTKIDKESPLIVGAK